MSNDTEWSGFNRNFSMSKTKAHISTPTNTSKLLKPKLTLIVNKGKTPNVSEY